MSDPNTVHKSFRVPADLWQAAMEAAADRDETVSDILRAALTTYTHCDECTCGTCGLDTITVDELAETDPAPSGERFAIMGHGTFSTTQNPEVQALIDRASELLEEGAVGVSIATDLNPADLPDDAADVTEEDIDNATMRPRHVAIVDTAAFAGAHLTIDVDGNLTGPVAFEGESTGDIRSLPPNSLVWDDDLLPIPIIFDLHEGDHTGVTVGFIDALERVPVTDDVDDVVPIAASVSAYPAYLFSQPEPGPMTVHAPDEHGYRRYAGTLVPTGVCHKGRGGCYTYKGADLDYFHSGGRVQLDDGSMVRVGSLVSGGLHADATKMDYREALAVTDDARRIVSMGRAFNTPQGLLFSGVLMPDTDVMRLQASAPSVELWPNSRGKLELKTALMVNAPAWPVAASVGAGIQLAEPLMPADLPDEDVAMVGLFALDEAHARLERIEKALALLVADKIRDLPNT